MGLDISLALTFMLFVRVKFIQKLIGQCNQSTPQHCNTNKELSSLASICDNSISILSDSSKAFLTLPGQVTLSKTESRKIYPAAHQSSSTYVRNTNSSSHLYESPKHLYNYEFEHRYHCQSSSSALNSPAYINCTPPNRNIYPLTVNNHLGPSIASMTLRHNSSNQSSSTCWHMLMNNTKSLTFFISIADTVGLRPSLPSQHQHFRFDRCSSIYSWDVNN